MRGNPDDPMPPVEVFAQGEPGSSLLCYLEGEAWHEAVDQLETWSAELAQSRDWTLSPPEFVNTVADGDRTVGVVLRIPSAGRATSREVERELLHDVEALIASAESVTRTRLFALAFELDGEPVGCVESGSADRQLVDGLLAPWRAEVESAIGDNPA
jgi:hypothetical protein